MDHLYLGIDCGTQGTKALILDSLTGQVLGLGAAPHTLIQGEHGRREQDTEQWLHALHVATRQALDNAGISGQQIQGIGVSGQQHGLVLLDADGNVLRPAKLWCDTESSGENQQLLDWMGGHSGSLERLGLVIAPGYTVSKLLWTRTHHPQVLEQAAHILLPHDYLNFWLTGRYCSEFGDASGTGYFNVRTRQWDLDILRHIDPSGRLEHALPELIEPQQPVGTLRPHVAQLLGINPDAVVSSGGGDNMLGAIGTGNITPGIITMSLGSSGTVYAFNAQPQVSPDASVASFCSSSGGWLPLICTLNLTNATGAVRELLGLSLEAFNHLAGTAPIGADGVSMLPFLNGERVPDPDQHDPGQRVPGCPRRHHLRAALWPRSVAPQRFAKPGHSPGGRRLEKRALAPDCCRHHEHPGGLHRAKRSRRIRGGDSGCVVRKPRDRDP